MSQPSEGQPSRTMLLPAVKESRGRFAVEFSAEPVPSNTILGLFGPSGSGKTTYVEGLLRILGPRNATLVPQADSLLDDLTAEQNVRLLAAGQLSNIDLASAIGDMADHLDVVERLDAFARDLSGGERRRILIMRSLLSGAPVLMMDEPFTGLGWADEVRARELVRAWRSKFDLILIVSHSAELVWSLCDRIWIVNSGKRVGTIVGSVTADNVPKTLSFKEADSLGVTNIVRALDLREYIEVGEQLDHLCESDSTVGFWRSHSYLEDRPCEQATIGGRLRSERVCVSRHYLRGERIAELRLAAQAISPPIVVRDRTRSQTSGELHVCLRTIIVVK